MTYLKKYLEKAFPFMFILLIVSFGIGVVVGKYLL